MTDIQWEPIRCEKCGRKIGQHSADTVGTIRLICHKYLGKGEGTCKTANTVTFRQEKSHTTGKNVI